MASTLKLVIEKGPRKGETLEFNPRSTVRIGRVVRGNSLPIKDSGISSKHLSIEFNSDSGKWVITDLDSSNGTFLNSSLIKPLTAFEINNGDDIKIGELTSIRVEIVGISDEITTRRNPRRQPGTKSGGFDLEEEGKNFGEGDSRVRVLNLGNGVVDEFEGEQEKRRGARGRGRPKKAGGARGRGRLKKAGVVVEDGNGKIDEGFKVSENVELNVGTRRTRSSRKEEDLVRLEVVSTRRTRSSKNEANVVVNSVLEKVPDSETLKEGDCKNVENVGVVEDKKRAGRERKKKVDAPDVDTTNREVSLDEVSQQTVFEERHCEVLELEGGEVVAMANTQQDELETTDREVPGQVVPESAGDIQDARERPCAEPKRETGEQNETVASGSHFEQETCDGVKSDEVLVEGEVDKSDKSELSEGLCADTDCEDKNREYGDVPDLERMTLAEWFDYLEVYLPKQIHNVTDEIIADMRKRAKQFDEFMLEQRSKGKLPMVA